VNIRSDWKAWDNLESVGLLSERGTIDYGLTPLTAKRRALAWKELAASGGAYTGQDLVWLIPAELLPPDTIPKLSDRIQDVNGVEWTILEAALNSWSTWWRLVTRNFVLSADLSELVTLQQPDAKQDAAGVRQPAYTTAVADLPARIQETEVAAEDRLGKRQAVRQFTAWVGRRIRPAANWRLIGADGTVYQITGWRSADRFDVLQELDLEIVQ